MINLEFSVRMDVSKLPNLWYVYIIPYIIKYILSIIEEPISIYVDTYV